MIRKARSSSKGIFGFAGLLAGIVLLVAFALFLNALFASRTSQITSRPQNPSSQSQSIPSVASPPAQAGWRTYTDMELGFSLRYPETWHEMGQIAYFEGRCFTPTPEDPRRFPQFCVDLKPYVKSNLRGFARNDSVAQQQFFENLVNRKIGQPLIVGPNQNTVVQHYQFAGAPAIELIETDAPDTEATERAYIVSLYVNEPQVGLIRLSMHAYTREHFEQHEEVLRQILTSFSLLK